MSGCVEWSGREKHYQREATIALEGEGVTIRPWDWITPQCGTDTCITPDHLRVTSSKNLAYPAGLCIYCGRRGHTKDHLLPRAWSGSAARAFVVTVPSCGTCNTLLADTLTWSITERRAIAHAR